MSQYLDLELVEALLRSPTFFGSVGLYLALAIASGLLGGWLLLRVRQGDPRGLRLLHGSSEGAAAAIDFTLVAPFFLAILFIILQFASLANGAMIVHYAAYVAARAARVHTFIYPDDVANIVLDGPIPNLPGQIRGQRRIFPSPGDAALKAARLALVAAAPATRRIPKQNADVPEEIYWAMARAEPEFRGVDRERDRARVFIERARFAFDPRNTRVAVTYPRTLPGSGTLYETADRLGRTLYCEPASGCEELSLRSFVHLGAFKPGNPVTATVSFPLRLVFPIAANLWCAMDRGSCERRGNHYFRRSTAKVTLL